MLKFFCPWFCFVNSLRLKMTISFLWTCHYWYQSNIFVHILLSWWIFWTTNCKFQSSWLLRGPTNCKYFCSSRLQCPHHCRQLHEAQRSIWYNSNKLLQVWLFCIFGAECNWGIEELSSSHLLYTFLQHLSVWWGWHYSKCQCQRATCTLRCSKRIYMVYSLMRPTNNHFNIQPFYNLMGRISLHWFDFKSCRVEVVHVEICAIFESRFAFFCAKEAVNYQY